MGDATYMKAVELAEQIVEEVASAAPDWPQVTAWARALVELTEPLGSPQAYNRGR